MKRLLCKVFGHDWRMSHYQDANNGWSWEWHKCSRCDAYTRMLVASREG